MSDKRTQGQKRFGIQENRPTEWFDPLYANASEDGEGVPWAHMDTHPLFAAWLSQNPLTGQGKTALVVGCGMGDDAIELEARGFDVTAFDVSHAAIDHCKKRFPAAQVKFQQADLLKDQPDWTGAFDFVLEIYTVQALPPKFEAQSIDRISSFVAPGGRLLVVATVGAEPRRFENGPPWPLTPTHADAFVAAGLQVEDVRIEQEPVGQGGTTHITTFKRP